MRGRWGSEGKGRTGGREEINRKKEEKNWEGGREGRRAERYRKRNRKKERRIGGKEKNKRGGGEERKRESERNRGSWIPIRQGARSGGRIRRVSLRARKGRNYLEKGNKRDDEKREKALM